MNYSLRFRPEVVTDLENAIRWYDARGLNLGASFLQESGAALSRIQQNPEQAPPDEIGLRSVRLHRFPYVVHYKIQSSIVIVFAIMFGGRDPSAWRERV